MMGNEQLNPSIMTFALIPIMVFQMALLGQGIGMIISSLTTKYRDLTHLVVFGTQLLMYASPIVYPLSIVPLDYRSIIYYNPMTSVIEGFRLAFVGDGAFTFSIFLYSFSTTIVLFFLGIIIFNRVEKTFIDTV